MTGLAENGMEALPVGITYLADHASRDGSMAESCLDHIYVTDIGGVSHVGSLLNSMSDHVPIFVDIRINKN